MQSNLQNEFFDVIIIGAGAAGLMCAATAGYRGKRVLVIDHAPKAGAKIRISGGTKCNFTNLGASPANYICQNPHFVKSALARFTPQDFIDLVDRHGLSYEQRELGKLFCAQKASDLIQILRTECDWAQVAFQLNCVVSKIAKTNAGFELDTTLGQFTSRNLVVATGGLSFPKLKASGFGYQIAQQFGLNLLPTRPGLVPLVFKDKWLTFCHGLSGISIQATVTAGSHSFTEAVLFTHQGLSGPAILQASNYWQKGQPIHLNLLPGLVVLEALLAIKNSNQNVHKWLQSHWPKTFFKAWQQLTPMPERLAEVSDEQLALWAEAIENWTLYPADTAGYDKAEVTLGGVDTDEISSKTLEAIKQPGLYFIGEVLAVTGQLGGYNFQWAWSSAKACGLNLE